MKSRRCQILWKTGKQTPKLRPGMTMAIEPMVNAGSPAGGGVKDGWTVVTKDGQLSAHFEHTVLITEGEPEILTWPAKDTIEVEGRIVEILADVLFRVELAQWPPVGGACVGQTAVGF